MRQAAKEFPGEEISESIKKIVVKLDARPVFSMYLNNVRLESVNVLQIPRVINSKVTFGIVNVGTAESHDPMISLVVSTVATNFLSGGWHFAPSVQVFTNKIESHPEDVVYMHVLHGRLSVGAPGVFPDIIIKPSAQIEALGMVVKIEGDGVAEAFTRLWIIVGETTQTNSIILTGESAIERLNRLSPRIMAESGDVATTVMRVPANR